MENSELICIENQYINSLSLVKQREHLSQTSFLKCSLIEIKKTLLTTQKSFPLRISSVNVTKYAGNSGFDHVY